MTITRYEVAGKSRYILSLDGETIAVSSNLLDLRELVKLYRGL